MVGADQGGQVAESIETFYFPGPTAAMHPSFLLRKLPGFLQESTWTVEYNKPLPTITHMTSVRGPHSKPRPIRKWR